MGSIATHFETKDNISSRVGVTFWPAGHIRAEADTGSILVQYLIE